ncbi:MAG: hypothetical protein N2484_12535 [Clostridia bacterium]|nr:hypothetical protein [Clostridia bacterium]
MSAQLQAIMPFIIPILPNLALILGGQWLLNIYAYYKKKRDTEIDLINSIRQQQYNTITQLYSLFSKFMELYRLINSGLTDLNDITVKRSIFSEVIKAESQIDALILKIGCEFADEDDNKEELESMLGNLRQSVQLWREKVSNSERLPFNKSSQEDYLRFKAAFSYVSAFMINKIHNKFEAPKVKMKQVEDILVGAFDNKHEKWNYSPGMNKHDFRKYYDPKM